MTSRMIADPRDLTVCGDCGKVHERCDAHRKRVRDDHGRKIPCGKRPPAGSPVCDVHGGDAPQVRNAATRRVEQAKQERAMRAYGTPQGIEAAEAMLQMVAEAYGNVTWLRSAVQALGEDPDNLIDVERGAGGGSKLVPHVLVAMYDAERKFLVQVAKACRDAGVDERRVKLAEQQGDLLAQVLGGVLDSLRAALAAAGAPDGVIDVVWRERAPVIVREQLHRALGEGEAT